MKIFWGIGLLFLSLSINSALAGTEMAGKGEVTVKEELTYEDCDGCHDGVYREKFDYNKNPECFDCHLPPHRIGERSFGLRSVAGSNGGNIGSISTGAGGGLAKDSVEMILVPGGVFIMGEDDRIPDEAPEHLEYVKSFSIDKYEVTNQRYLKFVKETDRRVPDNWENETFPAGKEEHPVIYVNWYDASDYCRWAGKRLPLEKEWEKGARGSDGRDFPWGEDMDVEKANFPLSEIGDTTPVGIYESGKSPYGLYDMAGNVYEWVEEWYYLYTGSPAPTFKRFSGRKNKIMKGGSWYNCLTYNCGVSIFTYNRAFISPGVRNNSTGFRCVKSEK